MFPKGILENRNGELYIENVSTIELVKKFDTPLYVISESRIRENYRRIYNALIENYEKIRIYYSAKANTNISILKILENEGAYVDTVSPGEVFLALKAGFNSEKILFTGTSVRNDELEFLLNKNITINIDSISQLNRLIKINIPKILSIRINPEIGAGHHYHCITAGKNSKFGLYEEDALKAYEIAKNAGIEKFGIHMHIGSGILLIKPYILAIEKLLRIAKKIHEKIKIDFEFIDIGGGLGVPYKLNEKELNIKKFSKKVLSLFKDRIKKYNLGEPIFCIEPGRYIVCDAGILLTIVNTVKNTKFKTFIGIDAGFNTLIRPVMYGSYHPIIVANKMNLKKEKVYDIVGPICESGDILAKNRKLPIIEEGDLIAILNAGAYGYSMSSQYNSRPRAAEVLVKNGKYELIRKREKIEDLLNGQSVAEWLK
jgi:diaminopimelate decarboxylase